MNQVIIKHRKTLWLKILIGVTLPITAILLLEVCLYSFTDARRCKDEKGFFRKLFCGISETYEDNAPYFRTLPTDEEMIENFHRHRSDFEQLVKIYREDLSVPTYLNSLKPTSSIAAVMKRINVGLIRGDGVAWMPPNPYSIRPNSKEDKLERSLPLFSRENRQFSGVIFSYAHGEVIRFKYGTHVSKQYYYVPFVPKVKNGLLILPVGGIMGFPKVSQTLNKYPPFKWPFECFCRQIEPHWFIEMCQTK